jgi:hypothetical protein
LLYIKRSQEDIKVLDEIDQLGVVSSRLVGFDFSDTAVVKPWGYEYLIYETPDKMICAWVLHMNNNGTGTSLHCHRSKKTRIVVLEGEILLKTIHQNLKLPKKSEAVIDQATFHSLEALSDNTILVEIESPSNKPDAVRWKDHWGRDRQEYEAQCDLVNTANLDCPYKNDLSLRDQIISLTVDSGAIFNSQP